MTTPNPSSNAKKRGLEHLLLRSSQALALFGGLVLIALTLITVYSIIGRSIIKTDWLFLSWWRPVRGDFELIELGTAVAIASFFPYCQLVRGNVLVDFFSSRAPARLKAAMAVFANGLFSAVSILISWRMLVGTHEFFATTFRQSSMILNIPVWQAMATVTAFMLFLSIVCLYTVFRSVKEVFGEGEPTESLAL